MTTKTIITANQPESDPFVIEDGQEIVLRAAGLQAGSYVRIEMLKLTPAAASRGVCCVRDPSIDIEWQLPLLRNCTLPDGSASLVQVKLTENIPWVVLRQPAGVLLRAILESDDPLSEVVTVELISREAIGEYVEAPFEPDQCCSETEVDWVATDEYRCVINEETGDDLDPSGTYQRKYISNGCSTEWRDEADLIWTATGQYRCVNTDNPAEGGTYSTEVEKRDQCGDLRWFTGTTETWMTTGDYTCATANDTDISIRLTTHCGDTGWAVSTTLTQVWTPQGVYRLASNIEVVEQQQTNQCGRAKWVAEAAVWTETGEYRLTDDVEVVQQKNVNQAGGVKWVDEPAVWTDTGTYRATDDPEVVQKQQVNQAGGYKWVDVPAIWSETGETRCSGDNVETQYANQAGVTKWVATGTVTWVETGTTRCVDGAGQKQEINDCGITRWTATGAGCGYVASIPLPGGGLAYNDDEGLRDPAADVQLVGCDDETSLGWIYPSAREGANTPVYAGCSIGGCDGDIIGYAVNDTTVRLPDVFKVKVTGTVATQTEVTSLPELTVKPNLTAVDFFYDADGQGYILWSDGTVSQTTSGGTGCGCTSVTAGMSEITTSDSTSVAFTGNGTEDDPLSATITVTTADSTSVDFSGNGTPSSPLTAVTSISAASGNQLQLLSDGLYAPAGSTTVNPTAAVWSGYVWATNTGEGSDISLSARIVGPENTEFYLQVNGTSCGPYTTSPGRKATIATFAVVQGTPLTYLMVGGHTVALIQYSQTA